MSWSPDLFIGELRPWPDSVHVVRGKTDEARRYMPERKDGQEALERRIDELCAEVEYNHQTSRSRLERIDQLKAENVKLRELARQMYPYAKAHLQLGVMLWRNDTMSYDWALQMVELGIEVD